MENLGDEWLVIYLTFTLLFGRNRICQTRYAHHMAEILMSFPAANSSEFVARLEGVPCPSQRVVDRGTTSMASLSPFRQAHSFLELSSVWKTHLHGYTSHRLYLCECRIIIEITLQNQVLANQQEPPPVSTNLQNSNGRVPEA
jgi:hypothetical protein